MVNGPALVSITKVALALGMSKTGFQAVAMRLGLVIGMERSSRDEPHDYERLIEGSRAKPQKIGFFNAQTKGFGIFATQDAPTVQQAHETAAMLKRLYHASSQAGGVVTSPRRPDRFSDSAPLAIHGREHAVNRAGPKRMGYAIDTLASFCGTL